MSLKPEHKDVNLSVKVTKSEEAELKAYCKANGISISRLLFHSAFEAIRGK